MIQLAMEIPTVKLKEWSPLADLDFVLAHTVLEDDHYARHFSERPLNRELILDNSYHELGYPLPMSDLLEAAQRCRADYIISPDKVGDVQFNVQQFQQAQSMLRGYGIAVVMTGSEEGSAEERELFLANVLDADMLCCTFKQEKRFEWFRESRLARRWRRVHLLGVSELEELRRWAEFSSRFPHVTWSVDTGKALKWALRGKSLDELESLRISPRSTAAGGPSHASLSILTLRRSEIDAYHEKLFRQNVKILQDACL